MCTVRLYSEIWNRYFLLSLELGTEHGDFIMFDAGIKHAIEGSTSRCQFRTSMTLYLKKVCVPLRVQQLSSYMSECTRTERSYQGPRSCGMV